MFDSKLFEANLATSWLGRSFNFFEKLDSTNFHAKKLDMPGAGHGTVILAENQTKGRGQYERKWEAEPGANLTFSVVFNPPKAERLTLLTLFCALAVAEVVEETAGCSIHIKWPNDILAGTKKVGGILTETQFIGNKLGKVIVGIGLNVNQQHFSKNLQDKVCSVSQLKKGELVREKLLASLLQKIEYYYRLWSQDDRDLVKRINKSMVGYGEWVHLKVDNEQLAGEFKFLGVNEKGELVALDRELDVHSYAYEQVRVNI